MDRSELKAIVDAHVDSLIAALGLSDWRLVIEYDRCPSGGPGEAVRYLSRQRARIYLDHDEMSGSGVVAAGSPEDYALEILRHELFHVLLAPFDTLHDAMTAGMEDSREKQCLNLLFDEAQEAGVRAIERMWPGLERYWRDKITRETIEAEKAAKAKARRLKAPKKAGGKAKGKAKGK
jgi:hypothetical protein